MGLKKCHWNKNLNFGNLHVRSWKRSFMKRLKLSFLKTLSTINVGRGLSRILVRALTMIIYMQRNVLPPKTLIPTQFLRFSPKNHFFHFQSPILLLMRWESGGGGVCVCVHSMNYKLGKTWTSDEALQQSGKKFFWQKLKRSANIKFRLKYNQIRCFRKIKNINAQWIN